MNNIIKNNIVSIDVLGYLEKHPGIYMESIENNNYRLTYAHDRICVYKRENPGQDYTLTLFYTYRIVESE